MSKFKSILAAAAEKKNEIVELEKEPDNSECSVRPPLKPMGRPRGKRSDPDYTQITAYIRQDTHKRVKILLLENEGEDFSELIERLLIEWLSTQKSKSSKV